MSDKSLNIETQKKFKRFLKKEVFLQTSLNFYLNWRETKFHSNNLLNSKEPSVNSSSPFKLSRFKTGNMKTSQFSHLSENGTNLVPIQNIKSFQNFSSKHRAQGSNFNKSHSYWLFPLFALIGSSELNNHTFQILNVNQFGKKVNQNSNLFSLLDNPYLEIPVNIKENNESIHKQFRGNPSLTNLHVELKRKLFNQLIENSSWKLQWWKFQFEPQLSSAQKKPMNLKKIPLQLREFNQFTFPFSIVNTVENSVKKPEIPSKMTPFKNILNKKFFLDLEDTNLQPIQSYIQSSLLYDSLFFNENKNSEIDLNCFSEKKTLNQNQKLHESDLFLFYLTELKPAEFWKTYFQSYLKTIVKKENIKNQFNSEALSLNQTLSSLSPESDEKFLLTSNIFEKLLFQDSNFFLSKKIELRSKNELPLNKLLKSEQSVTKLQTNLQNSLKTNFLREITSNFNSAVTNDSLFYKSKILNPISNSDEIVMNEILKFKTPILESNQRLNAFSVKNENKLIASNKVKMNFTTFSSSEMLRYSSPFQISLNKHLFQQTLTQPTFNLSWFKQKNQSSETEIAFYEKQFNSVKNPLLKWNLTGKIENLVWLRSKILNILKNNWNKETSSLTMNNKRNITNSPKKVIKIEKILRSYLSIKKSTEKTNKFGKQISSAEFNNSGNSEEFKQLPQITRNSSLIWAKNLFNSSIRKKHKYYLDSNNLEKLKLKLIQHLQTKELLKSTQTVDSYGLAQENTTLTPQNLLVKKGFVFINRSKQVNMSNINRIEKIKTQQKQRRRKKERRENRRRKKRKRFYPRPLWLRFSLYRKFLAKRYLKPIRLENPVFSKALKSYNRPDIISKQFNSSILTESSFDKTVQKLKSFSLQDKNNLRSKIYRTNRQFTYPTKEKKLLKAEKFFSVLPIFGENRFFYIPKFVIADFQRSLLKSYWLKANLKPYLARIQNSLDQINSNEKELNFLMSFKTLFYSFFKLEVPAINSNFELDKQNFSALELSNNIYLNGLVTQTSFFDGNNSNSMEFKLSSLNIEKQNKNELIEMNSSLTSKLVNLSEYNQILYKRILNFIKNIKLNLTTNGNVRPHPFHEGRLKQEKIEIHNIWNQLNQLLNFEFFSSSLESSGLYTNLRIIWSLNKTNLFAFKEQNDFQKIWYHSKFRDHKKSNKTRLLLTKLQRVLLFQNQKEQGIELSKFNNVLKKSNVLFTKVNNLSPTYFDKNSMVNKKSTLKPFYSAYRLKTPKRSLYFWWNSSQLKINNFNWDSQYTQPIILKNNFNEKNKLFFSGTNASHSFNSTFLNFNLNKKEFDKDILFKSCFLLLHICSLFALLQISQIRSFIKFAVLISIKMVTAYFMVFSLAIQRFVSLKTESKFLKSFVNPSIGTTKETNIHTNTKNENNYSSLNEKEWDKISYKKRSWPSTAPTTLNENEKNRTSFKEINSFELVKLTQGLDSSTILVKFNSLPRELDPLNQNSFQTKINSEQISTNQLVNVNSDITTFKVFLTESQLFVIRLNKLSIVSSYQLQKFVYSIFSKVLEVFESFLAFIYQFLEKPAEFMIDWIAQLFLVEWSSNLRIVMPDLLENNMWKTFFKISRNSAIFGLTGTLIQRRFLSLTETFASLVSEADTDLIIRQKKGQVFWEIWSEILMKAVDKYSMNLSSLTTLKDEQDRLLQNLINDGTWNWSSSSLQTLIPFLELQNSNQIQTWNVPKYQQLFSSSDLLNKKMKVSFFGTKNNTVDLTKSTQFIENSVNQQNFNFIQKQQNSWSTYQSITLQARESDLFIQFNPPHTFQNTRIFKHAASLQPNIGGIVCEIYAGIFSKKVAKNALVIGPAGREKTWLIQALAGETELKLMIDNAARYAIVQRGVAIGMKLLRDVFEGLALNAPCIFLIEDIHIIGEKRSLLISEDQINSADNLLGTEREEIHEKNQVISQVTRHMIAHYKKPYKGDFSMSIAANRFNFQLFLGVSPPITRQSNLTVENPLPYKDLPGLENDLGSQAGTNQMFSSKTTWKSQSQSQSFSSFLKIPKEQKFSPSAISPLSLLMLREQKKLKPKKRVKELPWFGLPADQANLIPKTTYSIRVKVAMLADLAISNLSVKLDMITELLVIIDSVRSNRGFMIFATTHLPYKLDPALRRPGRLDETLNLGLIPNFKDRLEILKLSIGDINPLTSSNFDKVREKQLFDINFISDSIFERSSIFFDRKKLDSEWNFSLAKRISRTFNSFDYSLEFQSLTQAEIQTLMNKTKRLLQSSKQSSLSFDSENSNNFKAQSISLDSQIEKFLTFEITQLFGFKKNKKFGETEQNLLNESFAYLNSGVLNLNAKIYSKTSQIVFDLQCEKNPQSSSLHWWNSESDKNENFVSLFEILYSTDKQTDSFKSKNFLFQRISSMLSKKVGEYLIFSNSRFSSITDSQNFNSINKNNFFTKEINGLRRINTISPLTLLTVEDKKTGQFSPYSLIVSLLEKRSTFNQNMTIGEFLAFQDKSPFKESPGPVLTSILSPLQKFENYKRTENDFQTKPFLSIQEKIQLHQHQRYLKNLYQKPIQQLFNTLSLSSNTKSNSDSTTFKNFQLGLNMKSTGFHNSIKELGYHDLILAKPTSVNAYYRNRILGRHRYYYLNQWWTGQLPEHNAEMTFSSDVDWRSKFIKTKTSNTLVKKSINLNVPTQNFSAEDIQIDFPDPDQYYNPRSRRWMLNSGYWATWNSMSSLTMMNFSSYYLIQNFQKTYNYLSDQREILDYFSYLFLKNGNLNEVDFIALNKF